MKFEHLGLILVLAMMLSGCDELPPPEEDTQPAEPAVQQTEQTTVPATPIIESTAEQTEPGMVREKARRGMGKKGQGYGGGIITQPVATYFQTQDRIVFSAQIPHQMNIFKAMNGRNPKDLEEFKKEILEPAQIKLPELRLGERYIYDPEKGELLIEKRQ